MRIPFFLLAVFFCSFSFAQNKAVIEITLENTEDMRVEKTAVVLEGLGLEGVDKRLHPMSKQSYSLLKIDSRHYLLECLLSHPEVFFLNYTQVFISPGDSIRLTYSLSPKNSYGGRIGHISAIGKNKSNYMYSNYMNTLSLDKYFPKFDDSIYRNNTTLYYKNLVGFYNISDRYIDSLFTAKGCDRKLVDYLRREKKFSFLFNLLMNERRLSNSKSSELKGFSERIDAAFLNHQFVPSDTSYTITMEKVFKSYLFRLVSIKFHKIETAQDFQGLVSYITKYPDPFVRDYLIYNLVVGYNPIWKKYYSSGSSKLEQLIASKNIAAAVQGF